MIKLSTICSKLKSMSFGRKIDKKKDKPFIPSFCKVEDKILNVVINGCGSCLFCSHLLTAKETFYCFLLNKNVINNNTEHPRDCPMSSDKRIEVWIRNKEINFLLHSYSKQTG